MEFIGEYFDRQVFWLDYERFLPIDLPKNNWICLATSNLDPDIHSFTNFVRTCLNNGIMDFKGHGAFGEKLHDLFDEVILFNKIENNESIESPEDFRDSPMTSWHNNETLADVFWQCIFATFLPENVDLDNIKIVCTDLDGVDQRQELKDYLIRFSDGWLPS
jgi:hypothetical protein